MTGNASPGAVTELRSWLRIPSISGDQRFAGDLLRAAQWLAEWLRAAGAQVRLVPAAGAPLVTGVFRGRRLGPPGVLYGHYDVQPPGPGSESPPFSPAVRHGRLFARRGASDDKGQFFAHLVALRGLAQSGLLGRAVLVVADGGEEIGSPGLERALEAIARPARAVVLSDTQRVSRLVPAITASQRGMVKLDVRVDVGGHPVHPGRFSGGIVDPSVVLSASITRLASALTQLPGLAPPLPRPALHPSDRVFYLAGGGRALANPPTGHRHHGSPRMRL